MNRWKSLGQQARPSKVIFQTKVHFDYFQIYPQILRLIALNWGVVLCEDKGTVRRARVEGTNNGLAVRQTLKRRQWWHIVTSEQLETLRRGGEKEVGVNMVWTGNSLGKETISHFAEVNQDLMADVLPPMSE